MLKRMADIHLYYEPWFPYFVKSGICLGAAGMYLTAGHPQRALSAIEEHVAVMRRHFQEIAEQTPEDHPEREKLREGVHEALTLSEGLLETAELNKDKLTSIVQSIQQTRIFKKLEQLGRNELADRWNQDGGFVGILLPAAAAVGEYSKWLRKKPKATLRERKSFIKKSIRKAYFCYAALFSPPLPNRLTAAAHNKYLSHLANHLPALGRKEVPDTSDQFFHDAEDKVLGAFLEAGLKNDLLGKRENHLEIKTAIQKHVTAPEEVEHLCQLFSKILVDLARAKHVLELQAALKTRPA